MVKDLQGIKNRLNMSGCFGVDRDGLSGGLALFWTDEVSISLLSFSKHHIDVIVDNDWRYTGIYGWPEASSKKNTCKLLLDLASKSNLPWMILGDFNITLHTSAKWGGLLRDSEDMKLFRDSISDCGLADISFTGYPFTWKNKSVAGGPGDFIQARLDRGLACKHWARKFPKAVILN
ncbi:uncharacterized protein [Rutidosis leptorrhynchoides]|uniref:uncharacterized protein n=1 Tax=Rutidosis leptorrhynchoides TaxID=125765 RepID=UPI003A9A4DA0